MVNFVSLTLTARFLVSKLCSKALVTTLAKLCPPSPLLRAVLGAMNIPSKEKWLCRTKFPPSTCAERNEARLCAFLMKDERTSETSQTNWVG